MFYILSIPSKAARDEINIFLDNLYSIPKMYSKIEYTDIEERVGTELLHRHRNSNLMFDKPDDLIIILHGIEIANIGEGSISYRKYIYA